MRTDLRSGFTTGTCAAAAAKAAAVILCCGEIPAGAEVILPSGEKARFPLQDWKRRESCAGCSVKKDAGDDPDVTDKAEIWSFVRRLDPADLHKDREKWYEEADLPGVFLTGGRGVGLVTKPGLSCPVGKHAINPVPRRMILESVYEIKKESGEKAPLLVQVEIPQGEELAKKTFNPRLGILGGLSVLGTTGIVRPMSEEALKASIDLEIHMKALDGSQYLILSPGNYGAEFLRSRLGISLDEGVQCSNFIAHSVRTAAKEGFSRGLLAGHAGKLVKAAAGVENTHSRYGDRRMEILSGFVRELDCGQNEVADRILDCNTTEEAVGLLETVGIGTETGNLAADRLRDQILKWTDGKLKMDIIIFSSQRGVFGKAGEVRL